MNKDIWKKRMIINNKEAEVLWSAIYDKLDVQDESVFRKGEKEALLSVRKKLKRSFFES